VANVNANAATPTYVNVSGQNYAATVNNSGVVTLNPVTVTSAQSYLQTVAATPVRITQTSANQFALNVGGQAESRVYNAGDIVTVSGTEYTLVAMKNGGAVLVESIQAPTTSDTLGRMSTTQTLGTSLVSITSSAASSGVFTVSVTSTSGTGAVSSQKTIEIGTKDTVTTIDNQSYKLVTLANGGAMLVREAEATSQLSKGNLSRTIVAENLLRSTYEQASSSEALRAAGEARAATALNTATQTDIENAMKEISAEIAKVNSERAAAEDSFLDGTFAQNIINRMYAASNKNRPATSEGETRQALYYERINLLASKEQALNNMYERLSGILKASAAAPETTTAEDLAPLMKSGEFAPNVTEGLANNVSLANSGKIIAGTSYRFTFNSASGVSQTISLSATESEEKAGLTIEQFIRAHSGVFKGINIDAVISSINTKANGAYEVSCDQNALSTVSGFEFDSSNNLINTSTTHGISLVDFHTHTALIQNKMQLVGDIAAMIKKAEVMAQNDGQDTAEHKAELLGQMKSVIGQRCADGTLAIATLRFDTSLNRFVLDGETAMGTGTMVFTQAELAEAGIAVANVAMTESIGNAILDNMGVVVDAKANAVTVKSKAETTPVETAATAAAQLVGTTAASTYESQASPGKTFVGTATEAEMAQSSAMRIADTLSENGQVLDTEQKARIIAEDSGISTKGAAAIEGTSRIIIDANATPKQIVEDLANEMARLQRANSGYRSFEVVVIFDAKNRSNIGDCLLALSKLSIAEKNNNIMVILKEADISYSQALGVYADYLTAIVTTGRAPAVGKTQVIVFTRDAVGRLAGLAARNAGAIELHVAATEKVAEQTQDQLSNLEADLAY
ncbi:MAG: hypothetical protein WCY36_00920, partial [Candidatus Omnitrophota bacterium]